VRPITPRRVNVRILIPLLVVGLIAGLIFAYTYWRDQSLYVSTDNAQVTGVLVQVGSVNAGRIADVSVDVGMTVQKDQQIATIVLPTTLTVTSGGVPRLGFRGTDDERVPVTAPADGLVVLRTGNPGDTVPAGQSIVTIADPSHLWVQAQIEETKIDHVHVGQAVDVHVDTLGKTLPGRVEAVDGAIAASFSLLPQGTTAGNFTKVTQLVPVKIAVDYGKDRLVYGSSVEVKIHKQ
jgi:multidrug resistance efflux pump